MVLRRLLPSLLNRFTEGARRCVEAALEEAGEQGHDQVGDEDLLAGILVADDGAAAEALASCGVSLEGAREEIEGMFSDALASVGVSLEEVREAAGEAFEMRSRVPERLPFSPRAKEALERSLSEALALNDTTITGKHLLLGILANERGHAARVLARLGVSARAVEGRLREAQ